MSHSLLHFLDVHLLRRNRTDASSLSNRPAAPADRHYSSKVTNRVLNDYEPSQHSFTLKVKLV